VFKSEICETLGGFGAKTSLALLPNDDIEIVGCLNR